MSEPLARTLGAFLSKLSPGQVPASVLEKTKLVILDAVANAVAGWDMPVSRQALALGRQWTNPSSQSTVWAEGLTALPTDCAFVNAVLIHSLLKDDSLPGSRAHGSSMIVPTALALAEQERLDGQRVLLATVVGYELQGRLSANYKVSKPVVDRGFRGSPVFGPFAAAGAAAVMLDLNEEQFTSAISLAANYAGGLLECMERGTPEYRFQNANAARSGLMAALLAREGAETADTALDGAYGFLRVFAGLDSAPAEITEGLGQRFEVMRVEHKPFPTCGNNQLALQALQHLLRHHQFSHEDIDKVLVRVHPQRHDYPGCVGPGPFATVEQALLSMPFSFAVLLLRNSLDASAYRNVGDPQFAALAARVMVEGDSRTGLLDCSVDIALRGGQRLAADASVVDQRAFHPSRDDAIADFHAMTRHMLPPDHRQSIIDRVLSLDTLRDVSQLTRLLVRPSGSRGEMQHARHQKVPK